MIPFSYTKKLRRTASKGFTLVEILVVLGLFSTVMVIAAGALFTTQAINTKLQETQAVLDNVNLSMEIMSREIRYGSNFHCTVATFTGNDLDPVASSTLRKSCPFSAQGGTMLIFRPYQSATSTDRVAYYLKGGILFKDEYIGGATTTYQVTTDNITINSLVFYVTGANSVEAVGQDFNGVHDTIQPLITLNVFGETKPAKKYYSASMSEGGAQKNIVSVKFNVQTSISSRDLDI